MYVLQMYTRASDDVLVSMRLIGKKTTNEIIIIKKQHFLAAMYSIQQFGIFFISLFLILGNKQQKQ